MTILRDVIRLNLRSRMLHVLLYEGSRRNIRNPSPLEQFGKELLTPTDSFNLILIGKYY